MTKPKPIAFYADRLAPVIGGMEVHADHFIRHFTGHPHFPLCELVTKNTQGDDELRYSEEWDEPTKIVFFNSGRWIEVLPEIRRRYADAKIFYRTGGNEIIKAPLVDREIVCHKKRQAFWVSLLNEHVDVMITNSAYTEERLRDLGLKCAFERCVGGVDCAHFTSKKKTVSGFRLFCAARFVPYKNHKLLIEVIRGLRNMGLNAQLYLAGDGPLLEAMQQLVSEYLLQDCVYFLGALSQEQVAEQIGFADCYIQLSTDYVTPVMGGEYVHAEGMGRSILEAISSGTYVIAGRSGALSEVVVGERGQLIEIGDVERVIHDIFQSLHRIPPSLPVTDEYDWSHYFSAYERMFA